MFADMRITPLQRAISKAGGLRAFAALHSVSYQAVQKWMRHRVPEERVPAIEQKSGGVVRAEQLRPDLHWVRDVHGRIDGHLVRNTT